MPGVVFDTQSLLAFYLGEDGSDRVEKYLKQVAEGREEGYVNLLNLAELYYIISRRSKAVAEEKERNLRSYGVVLVPIDDLNGLWQRAAAIKSHHSLSLADAFAAATAMLFKSRLLTGDDPEFKGIEGLHVERI